MHIPDFPSSPLNEKWNEQKDNKNKTNCHTLPNCVVCTESRWEWQPNIPENKSRQRKQEKFVCVRWHQMIRNMSFGDSVSFVANLAFFPLTLSVSFGLFSNLSLRSDYKCKRHSYKLRRIRFSHCDKSSSPLQSYSRMISVLFYVRHIHSYLFILVNMRLRSWIKQITFNLWKFITINCTIFFLPFRSPLFSSVHCPSYGRLWRIFTRCTKIFVFMSTDCRHVNQWFFAANPYIIWKIVLYTLRSILA